MRTSFIAAKDLKQKFAIFGNFYKRKINNSETINGRNILEIVAHDICPLVPQDITQMMPDAIMVMMNPGSSEPLVDLSGAKTLTKNEQIPLELVPTKPDTTQYQVMRIMHYLNWQHVRILNLSDLREAKSPLFIKRFLSLEDDYNYDGHSIFAKSRETELEKTLKCKDNAPILNGWGVSEKLDPIIRRAIEPLEMKGRMFGIVKDGLEPRKYFHPLPTLQKDKNLWVENMVEQLILKL